MKKIMQAIVLTVSIFFLSLIVISPIISSLGYTGAEASYHAVTHALIVSLIFTVIVCTFMILEELKSIRTKSDDISD